MTLLERPPAPPVFEPPEPLHRKKELHLLVGLLVAVLTVAFAAARAADGARSVLDARLLQAGAGVDAGVVDVESEQLAVVREIAFTQGVAQDVAAHDPHALDRLVAPLQANSTVPMVDVVLPDGRVLLALRSKGAPRPVSSRAGLPALAWSLRHAAGARGGRLSQVVVFRSGAALVTVGAVLEGTTPVGVVLAMTPLASVLGRLSQEVGGDLTVYDRFGEPLDTTATLRPPPLGTSTAEAVLAGGAVQTRDFQGGYREKLGRLIVDHAPNAVLGVSLRDDSDSVGRTVAIYAVIGLLSTVLILATFWARFVDARRLG